MALAIYATFTGTNTPHILTEVTVEPYHSRQGVLEVSTINLGIENTLSIGSATSGAGAGKATLQPITITRPVGPASPSFLQIVATGSHFDTVTFEFVRSAGDPKMVGAVPLYVVTCKLV